MARASDLRLALSLFVASGCAEPAYPGAEDSSACSTCERDTGRADARVPDATLSSPADAGTSDAGADQAWPKPLLGTYALRVRFFGSDDGVAPVDYLHEKLGFAIVREKASGEVEMEFSTCLDFAKTQPGLVGELRVQTRYPERLEPDRFTVLRRGEEFHTTQAPRLVGYEDTVPVECEAGAATAPRKAEQGWLGATCSCVNPESGPPTTVNDCRVTDPDHDGQPGVSIQLSGTSGGQDFVRWRDQSQIREGKLAANRRHTALWFGNSDYYQLQCASGICVRSTGYRVCPPALNTVEFEPLEEMSPAGTAWQCDQILTLIENGTLFPNSPLMFPQGC